MKGLRYRGKAHVFSIEKGGVTHILVAPPEECGCGRMTCFLVNRDGRTRCVWCDDRYIKEKTDGEVHQGS